MSQAVFQPSTSQCDGDDAVPVYVPVSGLYYQTQQPSAENNSDSSAANMAQRQVLVEQQDGTLLLLVNSENQGHAEPMEDDSRTGSHIDVKFCRQEMDFLHENFEVCEGASMPRSVIYGQYKRHCRQQLGGITPMNPASFGKLIRLVFAGIKTRRLGTRGNSKYHYYGLRLKPTSSLNDGSDIHSKYEDEEDDLSYAGVGPSERSAHDLQQSGLTAMQIQHQQFIGDASMVVLDFGSVRVDDNELLPEGILLDHLGTFEIMYHAHCEEILQAVRLMQLAAIPDIWRQFWSGSLLSTDIAEEEDVLPPEVMKIICQTEAVQKYVRQADYAFYSILLDVLIPDVLRPIPSSLTLVLRNFAKSLECWLESSMTNVTAEMVDAKKTAAGAFAQLLKRYTGLNHLAQAARTVLQNRAQVNRMYEDLCKVDFVHIQDQASWICECDSTLIHQLQMEVKRIFQQHYTLEQWASWLDDVSTYILHEHLGSDEFSRAARRFILTWSFYSSLVLRDLTLRSAPSFGAFHLIRLMFDEYISYTVEHKVAAATGTSTVAAFGNIKQFIDLSNIRPLEFVDQPAGTEVADGNSAVVDYMTNPSHATDLGDMNVFGLTLHPVSFNNGTAQVSVEMQPEMNVNTSV